MYWQKSKRETHDPLGPSGTDSRCLDLLPVMASEYERAGCGDPAHRGFLPPEVHAQPVGTRDASLSARYRAADLSLEEGDDDTGVVLRSRGDRRR